MNTKHRILRLLVVAIVALAALILLRHSFRQPSRSGGPPQSGQPFQSGMVPSPAGDRALLVASDGAAAQVWIVLLDSGSRTLITTLPPGQGARKGTWSPDGRMVAFEAFDEAGHSPMTTTHVWVAASTGTDLRELRLPEPNGRFSTYLEGWQAADSLRISATLLDAPEDVHFVYHSGTNRWEGPTTGRSD
jgi:hypothetical protein